MAGTPSAKWALPIVERCLELKQSGLKWSEVADELTRLYGHPYTGHECRMSRRPRKNTSAPEPATPPAPPTTEERIAERRAREKAAASEKENRELHRMLEAKDREVTAALRIAQTPQDYVVKTKGTKGIRATQVIMWSDWHVEEIIRPESVSHLNAFNEQVADRRIQACIANSATLMEMTAKDVPVDGAILWLGGDFITGNIHDELLENTWARPVDAMLWAQDRLVAGVRRIAAATTGRLAVVCNVGNHSRITAKTHFSTEQGNSLEYFCYHNMRNTLRDLKNVDWVIAEGYHAFVELYGKTIRFHHGHAVKYGGGIGGIFIPTYKAISQWNKARRADLDCFGHFHALKNGGNFICNGSLVGYNSFAVAIKADYERPYQKFFLYTNTGDVCGEYPIFMEQG